MSYELERVLAGIEQEMEVMAERDLAYTQGYGRLVRKARILRRVIRLFKRLEVAV